MAPRRQRHRLTAMRNPWADAFERTLRSQACISGRHDHCPHLCGLGAGLNPRRIRFESGAMLCKCTCHSSCPVTGNRMAVPFRTWRESCSCAGAEQERSRQAQAGTEFPDFREYLARGHHDAQLRREAFQAARAKAAGRSREEIRDLYESELRARGMRIPSEDALDAVVDAITGDYLSSARLLARSFADLAKFVGGIVCPPR